MDVSDFQAHHFLCENFFKNSCKNVWRDDEKSLILHQGFDLRSLLHKRGRGHGLRQGCLGSKHGITK